MTPRNRTKIGNPVWSDSYYGIKNLVLSPSRSDPDKLDRMRRLICEPSGIPVLPIDIADILTTELVEVWNIYQEWYISKTKCSYFAQHNATVLEPARE